ncbi:MAG: hypothetical protein IK152_02415 [Lachnospiraceae bacterium]|nr:hypothetical protein [Lachnospiraceae bacterium]
MLDMIQTAIYAPTVSVFDAYPNVSPELAAEIEDWKIRFKEHCEKQTDFAAFMGQFYGSDIQVESSNLLSRAAMEAMGGATQQNEVNSEAEVISVKDYLEQYRSAYDEVRAAGYRKRGEAAYEELLNVANRTDDMVEAQLIIEKERLLWKIVSEDTLDIYETIQEAMDPLHEGMTFPISAFAEVYRKATCDEDLTYELERLKIVVPVVVQRSVIKIFLATVIGTNILNYAKGKNKIYAWASDTSAQEGLGAMIACRDNIRTFIKLLKEHFDMSFEDMVNDEFTKLWLLYPRGLDSLGRIKRILDPQNLSAFKEIVNECLSDRTIEDILLSGSRYVVYFDLEKTDEEYEGKASERTKELDGGLTYYRYEATLKKTVESMCNIK